MKKGDKVQYQYQGGIRTGIINKIFSRGKFKGYAEIIVPCLRGV